MKLCKKLLASLLCVAMMLPMFSGIEVFAVTTLSFDSSFNESNYTVVSSQDAQVTLVGRYTLYNGVPTFISGNSGFTVSFTGTELWMNVSAAASGTDFVVMVDDTTPDNATRCNTSSGTGWLRVASGLNSGAHTATVVVRGNANWYSVDKIATNGSFSTAAKKTGPVIEAYGDSITEGACMFEGIYSETYAGYAAQAGYLLDADMRIAAISGGGIMENSAGECPFGNGSNPHRYYTYFAGGNEALGTYTRTAPDAIVINVGTNDMNQINNDPDKYSLDDFINTYYDWVIDIHEDFPDAKVVCVLGAVRDDRPGIEEMMERVQEEVVAAANEAVGSTYVYWMEQVNCGAYKELGRAWDALHPNYYTQEYYGLQLANYLNDLLGLGKTLDTLPAITSIYNTDESDLAQSSGVAYTSSSNYADEKNATAAFDGNDTSYWQAASSDTNVWVAVQLDDVYSVSSVAIDWNSIYATGTSRVEVSTDGSSWTTAASFTATSDADTVTFTAVDAKYVRLRLAGTSSDKGYQPEVLSFSVYGSTEETPEETPDPTPEVTPDAGNAVNLNLGNRVSAHANGESNAKDNAYDSDASTYWQGNSTSSNWLRVGYDGYYSISSAVIDWGDVYANGSCKLELSTDGLEWTTVKTFTPTSDETLTLSFTATTAAYARLTLEGSSDTSNNGAAKYAPEVVEFEVYGVSASAPAGNGYTVVSTVDSSKVSTLGKTLKENKLGLDGYTFTYGGSGLSVNFIGTELWLYCSGVADFSENGENFAVCVDTDMPMEATMVTLKGEGWYRIASGLENKQHTVTVRKQSRGFGGIMASTWASISHFRTKGTFLTPNPVNDLIIEVYGDSISNGDATWLNQDGTNSAYTAASYSSIVGRLLGADTRVCANTGNGLKGWVMAEANLQHDNGLPPQACWNIFDSQYNSAAWDHSGDNAADVVIINLGTNDRGDYGTGDLSCKEFADEYVRFIKQIKTDCPDAIVICTLGAMGGVETWGECIQGSGSDYYAYSYTKTDGTAVTGYCEASKLASFKSRVAASDEIDQSTVSFSSTMGHDGNVIDQCNSWAGEEFVYWVELEKCNNISGGLGYDNGHPSNTAQEIYGLQLATFINEKLNLGKDLPAIDNSAATVSTGVSKVVAQKSADGTANRVRFMAAVDSLDYSKVGFRLTVTDENGNSYTKEFADSVVYQSIAGVTAADLGLSGGYMFCLVVAEVPENATFTVTAFAKEGNSYSMGNNGNETEVALAGNFLTVR